MNILKRLFALPEPRLHVTPAAYRPDIDGLRAVAILSVMLFHAFPAALPGGFIGVDIFFVISGFLISRIVFSGLANGNFSFLDFYIHRIRRIFPALILVMLAVLAFGWFALLAGEYRLLGKHVAGGIAFIDNLLLWGEDSYFGTASELKPLMHLWSLGIEEQFYLIFPVLLVVLWRVRFSLQVAIFFVALSSFLANVLVLRVDAAGAFFLPQTRFWELLAGSALAYGEVFRVQYQVLPARVAWLKKIVTSGEVRSLLGLLLLSAGLFLINKGSTFPGRWALLPVLGAVLIIAAGPQTTVNRWVFANRGMVFIGLISYPLYLWHWPILSFLRILEARVPLVSIRIAALVLTLVLAWLTYRYFERPLRFGRAARAKALALLLVGMLFGVVGFVIYLADGIPIRIVEQRFGKVQQMVGHKAYHEEVAKYSQCNLPGALGQKACLQTGSEQQKLTMAIVGDSHAADLFLGLTTHLERNDNLAYFQVVCYPFVGITGTDSCAEVVPVIDYIVANPEIRTVILSSYWVLRLKDKNIRFGREPKNKKRIDIFAKLLALTLEKLTLAGKEVVFAIDVPDLDFSPEACLPSRPLAITERLPGKDCLISRQNVETRSRDYLVVVDQVLAAYPRVKRWDPYAYLCNENDCLVAKDGVLFYRDDNHLTPQGARWLGQRFIQSEMLAAKP